MGGNADLIRALLPSPETDLAGLFRDPATFEATTEAFSGLLDDELESIPAWRGEGISYSGVEGFREMWLDWLEPWESYRVNVEELIDDGERVAVLVRDRARRAGTEVDVELISGSVWTFRDGRICRVEFYANREALFEATGLRISGLPGARQR